MSLSTNTRNPRPPNQIYKVVPWRRFLLEVAAGNHKTQSKQAKHKCVLFRFRNDRASIEAKRREKSNHRLPPMTADPIANPRTKKPASKLSWKRGLRKKQSSPFANDKAPAIDWQVLSLFLVPVLYCAMKEFAFHSKTVKAQSQERKD